ncbi:MAG: hypothetical protein AMS23_07385 [Bacteroides sp. SM1_62]|nr:MAG: hypothetical protein AMS26_19685 [Bacteroides sp. SM23_62]KPL22816.1 MAG: hypothetical protein AMS23_07385 [Bacteroides sp. SM1_62]
MWYTGGQGTLLGHIGYATSIDGINWQKYENNPVLDTGPEDSWDHHAIGFPTVIIVNDTCHMWYAGASDQIAVQIGYATSTDGINWKKYENNPVIQLGNAGSWEETWVYMPCVIYNESTFHMWYSGSTGDPSDYIPWKEEIGYASSSDGKSWTKHSSNPVFKVNTTGKWDDYEISGPTVLFHNDMFHMWYTGAAAASPLYHIGYATSADGISWQRNNSNPLLTPFGWEIPRNQDPHVIFIDSTYQMWYSGGGIFAWKICYATSADGITWEKHPDNPVLEPCEVTRIIDEKDMNIPGDFSLLQNYPNPFNPVTTIEYTVRAYGHTPQQVNLSIYNLLGQKIATLVNKKQPAGSYEVQWDASEFASGLYIYQLKVKGPKQNEVFTKKLVLLK